MERAWTEECERLTKQRDYYHDEARHARALVIELAERIAALEAAVGALVVHWDDPHAGSDAGVFDAERWEARRHELEAELRTVLAGSQK